MLSLGGVPTEERFKNLTDAQWSILLKKYFEMKIEKYNNDLSTIEYLAQLVSPNPQAVSKIVKERRSRMEKVEKETSGELEEKKKEEVLGEDEKTVVKKFGAEQEYGVLNTSFENAIRSAAGGGAEAEEALKSIMGDEYSSKEVIYTMDKQSAEAMKNFKNIGKPFLNNGILPESIKNQLLSQQNIDDLKNSGFDTIEF